MAQKREFTVYEPSMKALAQIYGKAWGDPEFKKKLKANPADVLRQNGLDIPKGVKVEVLEDSPDKMHFTIPYSGAVELSDAQLDHISGGLSTSSCACTTPSCVSSASSAC